MRLSRQFGCNRGPTANEEETQQGDRNLQKVTSHSQAPQVPLAGLQEFVLLLSWAEAGKALQDHGVQPVPNAQLVPSSEH